MIANRTYERLVSLLQAEGPCLVSFSGGADSALLARAARDALGSDATAVTIETPYVIPRDIRDAKTMAAGLGIEHLTVSMAVPAIVWENGPDRCYHCKREMFLTLREEASRRNILRIIEGTNSDDLHKDRPGLRALKELNIMSPLAELGISKEEVRAVSQSLGLPTWNKPADSCLMTRTPTGTPVSLDGLKRIDRSERYLRGMGFKALRVRSRGTCALIETSPEDRKLLSGASPVDLITRALREFGFTEVCFEPTEPEGNSRQPSTIARTS